MLPHSHPAQSGTFAQQQQEPKVHPTTEFFAMRKMLVTKVAAGSERLVNQTI